MAGTDLRIRIFTPAENPVTEFEEGQTISASGAVNAPDGFVMVKHPNTPLARVWVAFGRTVVYVPDPSWNCSGIIPVPPRTPDGTLFPITVYAEASIRDSTSQNPDADDATGSATVWVKVKVIAPPVLQVECDPTFTLPERVTFHGTATPAPGLAIVAVQFCIDDGAWALVDNLTGNWAQWSKTIDLPAETYRLTVVATDTRQAKDTEVRSFVVRVPYEPTQIEQAFAPTTYLRELLTFAKRWIRIGVSPEGPSPQVLAQRFFQPFDQLTVGKHYEQAVRPVHPARLAVEVLRPQLAAGVPPATDQHFRFAAYQVIVRELGTSYEELRLARVADPATRQALAAQIGIEIEGPRPDRLDQITLLSNAVTDAKLKELFGYRSPAPPDDPLQPPGLGPMVLTWQFSAVHRAWQRDDARTRDGADGPLPVIDPDLISQGNIATQQATNPALVLWTTRKQWIDDTLADIGYDAEPQTHPLARFDQLVLTWVGNIDLADIAARDANGEDVTRDLAPFTLSLEAFRFLARCRELLEAGTLLDSEWQDIFAILLQTQKQWQYEEWRAEERQAGVVLEPGQFLAEAGTVVPDIPRWRGSPDTFAQWRRTLRLRVAQQKTVETSYWAAVDAAEAQTLPGLRDAVIALIGRQHQPTQEDLNTAAERLTRELLIDLRANTGLKTTRVDQALETLQGILFSVRSGRLATGADGAWTLRDPHDGSSFDAEWVWMGSYSTWVAAIRVFAYPENQLFPTLYLTDPSGFLLPKTAEFVKLINALREPTKVTPESARDMASKYLAGLRLEINAPPPAPPLVPPSPFSLTDQMADSDLVERQQLVTSLFPQPVPTDPNDIPQYLQKVPHYLRELFWLVPMALALKLQEERHYLAALDWFQTVYAFNLPPAHRKIYYWLTVEESLDSNYEQAPTWLTTELNPHIFAPTRKNAYTRFTVMSIVRCLLVYADLEFARNLAESTVRARTLYETAIDLLGLDDVRPETGSTIPFPANPVWESLQLHAQSNLAKIHNGMNIAGIRVNLPVASGPATVFLPSQYRYAVLVERAKHLVGIAQQVESAFLSAMEQGEAKEYTAFQANKHLEVAQSSIALSDLKLADADINVGMTLLQRERAQTQFDHYDRLIRNGLNFSEKAALGAMRTAVGLRGFNFALSVIPSPKKVFDWGDSAAKAAELASATAELAQTKASLERRAQDWQLQKNLADKDRQIGGQQIRHAANQKEVALQEQKLANLQRDHALEVVNFLANQFTNVELFEWMRGVLGRVYAYFLQQATAIAQLAQAQLAFERQETAPGFVHSDYWQDPADTSADNGSGTPVDRRGLTGSARLLQDIYRLDQYAFETDRRKLHLTQTLSLAQIAALELQQFRDTGLLVFSTPMDLFDREFPGHYLRLIKRVRISMLALVPSVRGVRATLSASGLSRVIVAGDEFVPVLLSRSPEAIAFTSPLNATGLFEMEPENGLLLPFEGMGLEAVWQLELPKPANPFDYRTIVDVLLTIDYTALHSYDYRQQVLRDQDRSFSGDRALSIRDQFPDVWYELSNPDAVVDAASRMRATLPLRREDFPPHVEGLAVEALTFFCVRKEGFTQELRINALKYRVPGREPITAAQVRTVGGIVGTRRPNGAPWRRDLIGQDPVGEWSMQLENTARVHSWFKEGLIEDLVLVMTVTGVTPPWL